MFKYKEKVGLITFDVQFKDRINILLGYSGEGKTFLFKSLHEYLAYSQIPFIHVDYNVATASHLGKYLSDLDDISVALLDNADLYLTNELFMKLKQYNCIYIISKKTTSDLDMSDAHVYMLDYESYSVSVRRMG